jgi:NADH-quinone oxidoreductase subunit C
MDAAQQKDAVLQAHAQNPAIAALVAVKPSCITNARFDRGELTLWIERDDIRPVCRMLQKAGYNFLVDVTCVDWYPSEPRFQVTYHILSMAFKERVRLISFVDTVDPSIDSITPVWPSANFYEREVFDLFGVRFHGHPNLRRIMMPDEWKGHPLRKDYPVEGYR